jgi:hypothetical protein
MDSVPAAGEPPARDLSTCALEEVRAWAQRLDHHGQVLERIRTVAVFHAQDDGCVPEDRKRWAKLALEVNARMPGDSPWDRARRTMNNTRLRTLIIERLGADPNDPDWRPEQVAQDILREIPLTPAQARELSDGWQSQPIDRIGELRRVKNISAPLRQLIAHLSPGPLHDQARQWLSIRPRLP